MSKSLHAPACGRQGRQANANECPKFKTKILKFELWHLTFWERMGLGSKEVRSIVISGYGTNCEMEMAHACRLAGSEVVDIVHINEPTIPVGPERNCLKKA
jgi:hypothetical protein